MIGVDNDEQACELASIPISSVDCTREMVAYEGAKLLDRLISGDCLPQNSIKIAPRGIVVRRSSNIFAVENKAVARALSFIREHYLEPINVNHVIRASLTSRCGLYRAFKKHVGRSVSKEIDRQRVEHAKSILCESKVNLDRIAHRSGFSGAEHFTRVFRRVTGITPSVHRRLCENEQSMIKIQ